MIHPTIRQMIDAAMSSQPPNDPPPPPIDGPRRAGDDGSMNERLAALEARFDAVLPTLATKTDIADVRTEIHKSTSEVVRWVVGTAIGGIAVFVTVMTFVLNNAVPKASAPAAQAPIIINVPAPAAAAAPAK